MFTLTDVGFSFLTSGPAFRLSLPADFDALPELSSPIFTGIGARSFVFYPTPVVPNWSEVGQLLRTLNGVDGRNIELYARLEPPPVWWLWWPLTTGGIGTHLREEDGVELADSVAAGVSIVETENATPFILLNPPLTPHVSADPGYAESATFVARATGWSVLLQRPGFLPPGKVTRLSRSNVVILRAGSAFGTEVQVVSGTDDEGGEELMTTVLQTLSEL